MNLIVFCRGTSGTRHFALTPPLLAGLALSTFVLLAGCIGLGFGLARGIGLGADGRLEVLQATLAAQQDDVQRARDTAREQVNALAIRVAERRGVDVNRPRHLQKVTRTR